MSATNRRKPRTAKKENSDSNSNGTTGTKGSARSGRKPAANDEAALEDSAPTDSVGDGAIKAVENSAAHPAESSVGRVASPRKRSRMTGYAYELVPAVVEVGAVL